MTAAASRQPDASALGPAAEVVGGAFAAQAASDFAVRIYYEDTDAGGVVYFANYLRFMERARTEWLRRLGFDQTELRERQGILFVVRGVAASYHRPARLDELLVVRSRLASLNRVTLHFEQVVCRGDETLVTGCSEVVCVDARSLRPCRMPAALGSVLQRVAAPAGGGDARDAGPTPTGNQ